MSRLFDDGGSFGYDAANGKLVSKKFGETTGGAEFDGKTSGGTVNAVAENVYDGTTSYVPYDYAATAAKVAAAPVGDGYNAALDEPIEMFMARVDNSLVGNMRDCGECHVGGGGMEFIPRNEGWDGTAAGGRVPYRTNNAGLSADQFTSFNYMIDVFDEDGDLDHNEVIYNNYANTGVVEVDCLMCHLDGYSWQASKDAKREGRFDASRTAGAGFGTINAAVGYTTATLTDGTVVDTQAPGYGTSVVYDADKVTFKQDTSSRTAGDQPGYVVNLLGKLQRVPPTDNCASCHQGKYQVDWKKRGEMAPSQDVHAVIGCMGCHERKGEINTGSVFSPAPNVGTSLNIRDGKLGHDPAKGGAGQWDSLNNKNDWNEFKKCNDCHGTDGDLGTRGASWGAPNPAGAHALAGLSAEIVQGKSRSGVPSASHLDIISCEACHITKASPVPHTMTSHDNITVQLDYASGGCFVDGTGPDHEGRLATHDTYEVSRPMYTDADGSNFGYTWAKDGKIHGGNFLTSLFWRDKNDVNYDVNVDGRAHGMDAVLPTHINAVAGWDHTYALLADGVSNDAEVQTQIDALAAALPGLNGVVGTPTQKLKLSWVTVPFTMSHQIEPAADAFGAGGCTDCHGSGQFFDGTIDLNGFSQFGFAAAQTAPMTKVQGGMETTFGHPNMKDKFGFISIPLMNNNGVSVGNQAPPTGATEMIRNIDRSEGLYEVKFRTRNKTWYDTVTGGAMFGNADPTKDSMKLASELSTTWKGWLLKLEVCDATGQTDVAAYCNADLLDNKTGLPKAGGDGIPDNPVRRSMMIGPSSGSAYNNITTLAISGADGLLEQMPANFTSALGTAGNFGFQVTENANANGIEIITDPDVKIRVYPQSNYGAFKVPGYVLQDAPIIPTCKGVDVVDPTDPVDLTADLIEGRDDMVAYLNALGQPDPLDPTQTVGEACFGLNEELTAPTITVDPVATTGTAVTVPADAVVYNISNYGFDPVTGEVVGTALDASSGSVTFTTPGVYRVAVSTTNILGQTMESAEYIVVESPPEGSEFITFNGDGTVTVDMSSQPTVDAVRVSWDGENYELFNSSSTPVLTDPMTFTAPAAIVSGVTTFRINLYEGTTPLGTWNAVAP